MKAEVRVVFTHKDMVTMAMDKLKAQGLGVDNVETLCGYVEYNDETDEYSVSFQLKRSGDE